MFEGFVRLFEADLRWLVECATLFFIPFLHEDVAILGGSFLVVERRLPASLALMSIYAGMLGSELLLYGLGVLARRSRRVRRALLWPRIEHLGRLLDGNVTGMVALARLVPGLMFPLYVGCGLHRVSFVRFAATTILTAAVYLPIVFLLVSHLGRAVLSDLGHWAWLAATGLLVAFAAPRWVRGPNWRLVLRVSASRRRALLRRAIVAAGDAADRISHRGMPALGALPRAVALAERVPPALFYVPLGIQWMWLGIRNRSLSLPTLANPRIEVGGLWGESKSSYLAMVGPDQRRWIADFTTLRRGRGAGAAEVDGRRGLKAAQDAGLSFPLVAKPDIGWRGFGVRLIEGPDELADYIRAFPEGETIILQQAIPFDGEACVLYARSPDEPAGTIVSLTFRYFPYVIGDGRTSLRDLILADRRAAWKAGHHFGLEAKHIGVSAPELDIVPAPGETVRLSFIGSNRVGGLYRDARQHITPELVQRFDAIAKSMPEFYYGRYDVRFASTEGFRRGEDFSIIEINGAGGESINVWDPSMPLLRVYGELFVQQRVLFNIGARNRARGYRPAGVLAVARSQWRQLRLIMRYPPSG